MAKGNHVTAIVLVLVLIAGGAAVAYFNPLDWPLPWHKGHDEHEEHDEHDEHAGEDADEDADEDSHADAGHDEAGSVKLTAAQADKIGLQLAKAEGGVLAATIRLPGQIALNADRTAHVTPRSAGIVREVLKTIGQPVTEGEVMAWIESTVLGEAKVDYLSKLGELDAGQVDLARAQQVHDNTLKLLDLLKASPSVEQMQATEGREMGENRGKLISAYAELAHAKAGYEREKRLFDQKVGSESDLQAAESAFKKARADYLSTRDSIAFAVRRALLAAQRSRRTTELAFQAAERKLYLLGLSAEEVAALRTLQSAAAATSQPAGESIEKLGWYPIRAPFAGTVIDKHLTLGEKVTDEDVPFTVADLASVWVDFHAPQDNLGRIRRGQDVHILPERGLPEANAKVAYVAPVVDDKTQTGVVRIVLPNPRGLWRPGLFVRGQVLAEQSRVDVLIPKDAVQTVQDRTVVFLPEEGAFEAHPVVPGRMNKTHVEVVSGLTPGQEFVQRGAFELKAKLVTSGLGAHAGHGH